ncbi:MAG: ribosome-binding factor A, partial [Pseudomonadota bacterium]
EALRRNAGQLRRLVSRDLHLKYAPELKFVLDDSFDRMDRARALLDADRVRRDTRPETDAEPEAE